MTFPSPQARRPITLAAGLAGKGMAAGGQLDEEVSGEAWRPGLPAEPRGEGRRLEIVLTPAENSLQNFISSARRRWGRGQA